MLKRLLARLASDAPVPVFASIGSAARDAVEELGLDGNVFLVDSPRHAHVLLLAGCMPAPMLRAALGVHDALPHPRGTVWWPLPDPEGRLTDVFPDMAVVGDGDHPTAVIVRLYRDLIAGRRRSEPPLQPDVPPRPWRGVGPYGQGGTGMMGGHPYGRPLAGRAPDRDGLELDQLPLRVGPFFPGFPPGLVLYVKLQGDVVQEVRVGSNPFDRVPVATDEPRPIVEVERARARAHLRALSRTLRVHGLHALSQWTIRLARQLPSDASVRVRGLRRVLERTRTLQWATAGVGILPRQLCGEISGPNARASGLANDTRANEPAYAELGFEVITQQDGDAFARWRQRLAEATQSLALAERAGGRVVRPSAVAEPSAAVLLALLPALLKGQQWGDAVTTLVSLDLDLEEPTAASLTSET